ncbi:unnamed protein product [Acanthoscelides obtectus]|nr:unnamed protein product [Acanthoscelides obtectus]CAK1620202.1 hypothetical protein AOBTE_LOCUS237 [Acanthoscelides obtectus]
MLWSIFVSSPVCLQEMWQQELDDSDDEETRFEISPPSHIIIMIDTHPKMFIKDDVNQSDISFRNCLAAVAQMAEAILFETSTCPFAIVLAKKDNIVLRHFKDNMIETIRFLNEKLKNTDDELKKEYMRDISEPLEFSNFLLHSKKVFLDAAKTYYKRILLFLTNNDNPHIAQGAKYSIINEAKSLKHADITFKIIATSESFNFAMFYNEIFEAAEQNFTEEVCVDVDALKEKLTAIAGSIQGHKKVNFYITMEDAEHVIKCYKFKSFKKHRILNNASYTRDGSQVVKTNAPPVYKYKVVCKYGYSLYDFDKEKFENKTLDCEIPYGYTFLYVTDQLVKAGENIHPPKILVCDSHEADEEKQLFRKFWDVLVECGKVFVCYEKSTRRNKIEYAQLSPYLMNEDQVFLIQRIPFGTQVKWPLEMFNEADSAAAAPISKRVPQNTVSSLAEQLVDLMTDETFNFKQLVHGKIKAKKDFVKSKLFDLPFDTTGPIEYTKKQEADAKLGSFVEKFTAVFPPMPERGRKRPRPK